MEAKNVKRSDDKDLKTFCALSDSLTPNQRERIKAALARHLPQLEHAVAMVANGLACPAPESVLPTLELLIRTANLAFSEGRQAALRA